MFAFLRGRKAGRGGGVVCAQVAVIKDGKSRITAINFQILRLTEK